MTPPQQLSVVRQQQMSLLTELATRRYHEGKLPEALTFARRALDVAEDAQGKRLAEQNIAAIASQELLDTEGRLSDAALLSFADSLQATPSAHGNVQALALTLVSERRLKRGDVNGSATALREAAGLASSEDMRSQAKENAVKGELNRLGAQSATDPEAAWSAWKRLGPPGPQNASAQQRVGAVIAQNRCVQFANDGRCPELEAALADSAHFDGADALRGSCRARHGLASGEKGDFVAAIDDLRAAVRLAPGEPIHRKNLAVMIEKQVDRLVHNGRCTQSAPLIAEGRALAPEDKFFGEAAVFCAAPTSRR